MTQQNGIEHSLHEVTFRLQAEHDFRWLERLGRVFAVFDQQDSGNIGFGVKSGAETLFIKYAGAKTLGYSGTVQDAIARLQAAVPLYEQLRHPALVSLVRHFAAGEGYAAVFQWFEGESLHPHWSFPPPAKYIHPDSPYYRFKQLPLEQRLEALNRIFSFHAQVEAKGYVAVDFYDGSLMYDFKKNELLICDIDLYEKSPFINTMGRLWGSSRFMSPEEFEQGAVIDEQTQVFTMGATAFALLGGELDRALSRWEAGEALYQVALQAVQADRAKRYPSMVEFKRAWELAVQQTR